MTSKVEGKNAVIYVRVSTKEQVDEGNSLATQERICNEYATKHGYAVVRTFVEQGESAKTANRTELRRLLEFCASKKNAISAIIVYKIDRLSRNTDDYSQIRLLLKRHGVSIKSTSENIEDTPVGRFMENTMANVAQFDNDIRTERCSNGMKDAVRAGRYVWQAPIGYKNVRSAGKATIAPDPVLGVLVRQSFELMSSGTYAISEVWDMTYRNGLRKNGRKLSRSYFYEMLRNDLYTGWISKFDERHRGLFDAIVDDALFARVQRVLDKRGRRTRSYQTDNADFPLRRFVVSPFGLKLTGGWSTGKRGTKHPYYNFRKGGNFQRDALDAQFAAFMDTYGFDDTHVGKLYTYVREEYDNATRKDNGESLRVERRLAELDSHQNDAIRKNLKGIIPDEALGSYLSEIDEERGVLKAKVVTLQSTDENVEEAVIEAESFLRSPGQYWRHTDANTQRELQWFEFPSGVTYDGKKFRTPQISPIFAARDVLTATNSSSVDRTGLEPVTSSMPWMRSTR